MFDAHTHLNDDTLYPNRRQHITDFQQNGGIGLINVGTDGVLNERGLEISRKGSIEFPQMIIKNTIGLHPYEASIGNITTHNLSSKLQELKALLTTENLQYIVAIGEIGIDTHYPGSELSLSLQQELFKQQLELASQYNLPVVIHSRANREATHEVLKHYKNLTIHFHCRGYGPEEIQIIQHNYTDYYIGFCANITYPKATELRQSLRFLTFQNTDYPTYIISGKELPSSELLGRRLRDKDTKNQELGTNNQKQIIKNLLIETDAPYLPPQSLRGKLNYPIHILYTYNYISKLLGYDLTPQIIENTKTCYHL